MLKDTNSLDSAQMVNSRLITQNSIDAQTVATCHPLKSKSWSIVSYFLDRLISSICLFPCALKTGLITCSYDRVHDRAPIVKM